MQFQLGLFNLWFPFLLIYASIWIYMIVINKKTGRQIEDPEIYSILSKQSGFVFGFLPTLLLFAVSIFVPIQFGRYFNIGVLLAIIGSIINLMCFNSFANNPNPLNTKGIYKYSRNPMYVSGLLVFSGIVLMGFENGIVSYIFIFFFLIWILSTHYMVIMEERFLTKKYGDEYLEYKKKVRRYL
jgi:protein-S-isoprenylcysteine O-methyltransferase Ste14